ncbi:oxygenase MpaB family protein [Gordonia sp. ABSL11-1]|uniref:oxygenase MpaB family protein n=1 Tax=Gordonia sp. ABSL11-1 TaxID=3053924 RepID=UPI0025738056|nr:oxygenase MpaB family protein [Gordonia sp. ABSL11-1]MDL9948923.1 oxygenase MpaB family protein [Gordonia sp. ABSL11-1]
MEDVSRRNVLKASGALGAAGALTVAGQSGGWSWSPANSVPGRGTGADPHGVWDPEADKVIAALLDRGEVPRVNKILRAWQKNGQPLPAGLPGDLRDFIEDARQLPAWTDRDKLATAVRFNQKRGTYLGLLYGFASGMMSTVIPKEARAVYYSKGGADMKDRITKTAKLGYDIGSLNAYQPDGEMVVTCVKTRMAHAAVRHLLPQSPWWTHSADEKIPISQADIMNTWHSLPTTVMRHFDKWNVPIAADESEGFLHSWQVSAAMLGVKDEYIPKSWSAADAQAKQTLDPILAPTAEGKKLANILLDLGMNLDLTLLSRGVLGALTRFTLGDKIAGWLDIPREPVWTPLFETLWTPFVAVREGLLHVGMPKEAYWMFDEFLRQFVLLYMSELRTPINIEIPVLNNPHYK